MDDVVIVGGGPTGLFLACELRLAGVRPVVLERLAEPDPGDKAHGLAGQVVRLLDHRGLYERCGGRGAPSPAPGHFFSGIPLPLDVLGADNPLYLLACDQRDLERVLAARAAELGVEVRRGWEMESFAQADDRVVVRGAETTLTARYLVGCDGAHSRVRKESGIGFPGHRDDRVVNRMARIGASEGLAFAPGGRVRVAGLGEIPGRYHRTERGVISIAAHDPARPMIVTTEWEDEPAGPEAPMTMAEMSGSVERVLGVRVPLTPPPEGAPRLLRRMRGWNTRVAERYRDGRVFIAGDAAHVSHGPTLNTALNDAANLAWKLAAAVRGWAPDGLLDTYETERHTAGERVGMQTQVESALASPGPEVTAMRQLFTEFMGRTENVRAVAGLVAGADVRYDVGEADPAGYFAPSLDVTTEDGRTHRLAELLHDARPVLLDLTDGAALAATARPWSGRVRHIPAKAGASPALLIRPDGYVAWSGTGPESLKTALTRWFGPPCTLQAGRNR